MNQLNKIAGCDCGKNSLTVCVLSEPPADLKRFSRRFKPIQIDADRGGVEYLLELADEYVLEPTGNYSRLWLNILQEAGKTVRLVNPSRVKSLMRMAGITNKSDRIDCAAIATYGILNRHSATAFLPVQQLELKQLILDRNKLIKSATRLSNQIGNRLTYEAPELVTNWESVRPDWGSPPNGIRLQVAGIDPGKSDRHRAKRANLIEQTIGSGLSSYTQGLGKQLVELLEQSANLEHLIDQELQADHYQPYRKVFQRFELYPYLEAALLSSIYPFEKFLGENGRRIIEYVPTKRDRSEGGFKLSIGMGKVLHQSGGVEQWKAGGSKVCRTAIWQYTKTVIVMARYRGFDKDIYRTLANGLRVKKRPWLNADLIEATAQATDTTPEIAKLRLHFEFVEGKKGDRRVSATAGLFSRMLYKALLKEFQKDRPMP